MDRLVFSTCEVRKHIKSKKNWHEFIRSREVKFSLSLLNKQSFKRGLEIGAGDGGQSDYLKSFCKHLVCTEVDETSHSWLGGATILERDARNIEYEICDAQDLSCFQDKSFDLIYSSNVLEHIQNIDKCLSECRRVLAPDGMMLHLMPSRWWKSFNFILFFPKLRYPLIHGEFENHFDELLAFGLNAWKAKFKKAGFEVTKTAALPFYMGHGHHFSLITMIGNMLRIPGSYAYISRKQNLG